MSLVSPTIRLFHTRAAAAVAAAGKGMEISIVPMLKDNLGYLVRCKATQKACFIDISHSSVSKFYHALDTHHVELSAENLIVLTTHKHADHSGGNLEASELFYQRTGERLRIYGDGVVDQTPGITHSVCDDEILSHGNLIIRVIQTPCHTRGSLCYHITTIGGKEELPGALFTGDTMFVGGIGAFFEGNSEAMVAVFQRLLPIIPRETILYCGHDYAMNFLPNALARDPNNQYLQQRLLWAQHHRDEGTPAMPTTFEDELQTNLFLRVVSHPQEMALLYPQWNPETNTLDQLMSLVYDTV